MSYWSKWRAAHPGYRAREVERRRRRRQERGREDRTTEYANRPSRAIAPLPDLFPDLRRGDRLMFREEELARDLRQERALAELEGRDPDVAVRSYRARERTWLAFAGPLLID